MNQMTRHIRFLTSLTLLLGIFCATAPRQSVLTTKFENVKKSAEEIRAVLYRTVVRFDGVIEDAADSIKRNTNDMAIQRNALLWKMYGIPAIHQAAFHPDPVVGLLDIKALMIQMYNFFETGAGAQAFGKWQSIAIDGLEKYSLELDKTMRDLTVSGDITVTQEGIQVWADENPMEDFYFQRASTAAVFDTLLYDERRGLFDATGLIADGMSDLSGRMNILMEYMPRQARWQAEYLLLVESSKLMNTVIDSLQFQLNALLDSIDMQRIATLVHLQNERIILTDFLDAERIVLFQDANTLTNKMMADVKGIIDDLRGMAILLGIVLLGIPLTLGIIIGRMIGRKG